ncbi:MAG: sugar kinase [Planctomycetota bacterium]|nr:sugar kinase [Planctomycetota bacterium]RLS36936.1 MAG: sugar kinase [Planctomycetota bacterium]
MAFDCVTFGEAMVRLAPPNHRRLEQARTLDVQVGGAELNTAVGLARLGRTTSWVSRLTENPLGRLIANHAREGGADTSHVLFTPEDRVGLYFLEFGAAPRASGVVYDRKNSAIAAIQPGMIDWDQVFTGARWFHWTGILPALSASAAAATLESCQAARKHGLKVSVDLNYRAKLWTGAEAGACLGKLMEYCDLLITTEEDIEKVFGIKGSSYEDAAARVSARYGVKKIAITLRENPLVWLNDWTAILWKPDSVLRTRSYKVEIVDRLGAGDSFAAGLIHGLLDGDDQKGLDWGVAMSAIKHTIPGDFAWITADEVASTVKGGGLRIAR